MSILIGAAVFTEAIKMLGGITIISNTLAAIKNTPIITMALMSMMTSFASMFLSSGNASWYVFGPLVLGVIVQMGVFTATTILLMQLSSGIGRCMSPVAGVVIAILGMAELDIMDIVRGCSIPAIITYMHNLVVSYSVV